VSERIESVDRNTGKEKSSPPPSREPIEKRYDGDQKPAPPPAPSDRTDYAGPRGEDQ